MREEFSAYQDSRSWETCPKAYSRVVIGLAKRKRRREQACKSDYRPLAGSTSGLSLRWVPRLSVSR
jgi:hypothetical protein